MSAPLNTRTTSQESADSLRKRVCKACDRCRLKKSKCDGNSPCSRCIADNSICVFGERKKSHDKVYPKGYVEMLEQQQSQLVAGMQDMYRRLMDAGVWPGKALQEPDGHPLTHDILTALNILNTKSDGQVDMFEEDPERLQQRLLSQGATYTTRRGSISSESEHSHTLTHAHAPSRSHAPSRTHSHSQGPTNGHSRSKSHPELPTSSPSRSIFKENLGFNARATPSPVSRSPVALAAQPLSMMKPSPLHTESPVQGSKSPAEETLMNWEDLNPTIDFGSSAMQHSQHYLDTQFNLQLPPSKAQNWTSSPSFDSWQHGFDQPISYNGALMQQFPGQSRPNMTEMPEWQPEQMDFDFGTFVQVTT